MTARTRARNRVTREQYPKFFAMARRAALNLGIDTPAEIEEYRRRVMQEEAGVSSIKDLSRTGDFDACVRRFAADAGDYLEAIDIGLAETRRRAYVIKVLAIQVMQLKGGDAAHARDYLEGIINQARVPCGVRTDDDSFWMDVSPKSVNNLIQILDTYRRRLLKAKFSGYPLKFDDTVWYEVNGPIAVRITGIPPSRYSDAPFTVTVR